LEKSKELGVTLNPPATNKELELLRKRIKQEPPKDIVDFYSYCNGFETLDCLFRIIPINELEYTFGVNVASFYFAEYMIYSDEWANNVINSTKYSITNGNHNTEQPVILSNSVIEFLERYASEGVFGLHDWFEENKLKSKS
jgi:hypothetical protein